MARSTIIPNRRQAGRNTARMCGGRGWHGPLTVEVLEDRTLPSGLAVVAASSITGSDVIKPGFGSPQGIARPYDTSTNLAFMVNGFAQAAVAKDTIAGYSSIHQAQFANDGSYGNGSSWISASANSWIKIDLGRVVEIGSLRFGRDRTGNYNDRDPGQFTIAVAITDNAYANANESNDQVEYTQVFGSAAFGFSGVVNGAETWQASFTPLAARYVKLTVSNAGACIDEIEVHEQATGSDPPAGGPGLGTLIVRGTANPFLVDPANRNIDPFYMGGTLPPSLDVSPGLVLSFDVSGQTGNFPANSLSPSPDGAPNVNAGAPDWGYLSGYIYPHNALIGVFWGPTLQTRPPRFGGGTTFTQATPELGQVFFIGDGLSGTGTGGRQEFVVPEGTTKLYLGSADGREWGNNEGAFTVTVTDFSPSGTPTVQTISIEDAPAVVEGEDGTTDAVFKVKLSSRPSQPVTVAVRTEDDATGERVATAEVDYEPVNRVLTFRPEEPLEQEVRVPIIGDQHVESNEFVSVIITLGEGSPGSIEVSEAVGTIENDDLFADRTQIVVAFSGSPLDLATLEQLGWRREQLQEFYGQWIANERLHIPLFADLFDPANPSTPQWLDFDGNGTVTRADALTVSDHIIERVREDFQAYNVDVVVHPGGDLFPVFSTQRNNFHDTLIFVSPLYNIVRPTSGGNAPQDFGNQFDQVGFVYATKLVESATGLALTAEGRRDILLNMLTLAVSHEAGHTLGLQHVSPVTEPVASNDPIRHEMMTKALSSPDMVRNFYSDFAFQDEVFLKSDDGGPFFGSRLQNSHRHLLSVLATDSHLSNQVTVPWDGEGNVLSFSSTSGTRLVNVQPILSPAPGSAPNGIEFPIGHFDFSVEELIDGKATVTIILPPTIIVNSYWKYGPIDPGFPDHKEWYEFEYDGETGAEINGNVITLHFVDGKRGDDDLVANGIIRDPGSPAFNPPPSAVITGPLSGVRGQPQTFLLSATDPSPVDTAAGFDFEVNWGDGTTSTIHGPSGTAIEHVFAATGTYVIQVTAKDKDGGVSEVVSHTVTVAAYEFRDGVLTIGGTAGGDVLLIHPGGGRHGIKVHLNGNVWTFRDVDRIVVFGQDGNDLMHVTESVRVPVELYGGKGDDILNGGGGPAILDGGDGDDLIVGGRDRNVMIGGFGSDILLGLGGDDLLISGDLLRGSLFAERQQAVRDVLTRWSAPIFCDDRVDCLLSDLRTWVVNDDGLDLLVGGRGQDWFLADRSSPLMDLILDRAFRELVTDIG